MTNRHRSTLSSSFVPSVLIPSKRILFSRSVHIAVNSHISGNGPRLLQWRNLQVGLVGLYERETNRNRKWVLSQCDRSGYHWPAVRGGHSHRRFFVHDARRRRRLPASPIPSEGLQAVERVEEWPQFLQLLHRVHYRGYTFPRND